MLQIDVIVAYDLQPFSVLANSISERQIDHGCGVGDAAVLRGDGVAGVTSTAVHSSTSTVPHQWARAALHRTRRTPPKLSTSARRHHAARSAPLHRESRLAAASRVILPDAPPQRRGTRHSHLPCVLHTSKEHPH